MKKEYLTINLFGSLIVVVAIYVLGIFAVAGGQYTWDDIAFIAFGCAVSFFILNTIFDKLRDK